MWVTGCITTIIACCCEFAASARKFLTYVFVIFLNFYSLKSRSFFIHHVRNHIKNKEFM